MTHCRNATLSELQQVLGWAEAEGWNPGLDDAEAFFQADPGGFFVAVDAADKPIAAVSVVNHTDTFAFLGLYIVTPEYRGQGIGLALWTHAIRHAGDRTIGLDGVEAQQANYRSSGFVLAGGTTRLSGVLAGQHDHDIRHATTDDVPRLVEWEGQASGALKPAYLTAWFSNAGTRSTLVLESDGRILGFATVRGCRIGTKIGPIVADTARTARRLILHAATLYDGPVTVDVPDTASDMTQLCQQLGLEAGFRTARMYRGKALAAPTSVYAMTSLELG